MKKNQMLKKLFIVFFVAMVLHFEGKFISTIGMAKWHILSNAHVKFKPLTMIKCL